MVITEYLERNARLWGNDIALVEVNPSEERDAATTWREASLVAEARPDAPYRRELSWRDFDRRANRFANLLLSRGTKRGTKVAMLLMNCLEFLPIYFGILKAGCVVVPMNYRYSGEEIRYCLDLADVEILVFGPEFVTRMDAIRSQTPSVKTMFFVGRGGPDYTEDCLTYMSFCSSAAPPVALDEEDDAAIYFSSGTTGFRVTVFFHKRSPSEKEGLLADRRKSLSLSIHASSAPDHREADLAQHHLRAGRVYLQSAGRQREPARLFPQQKAGRCAQRDVP